MLSSPDFCFLDFLLIVLSGFLGCGRACLEPGPHFCGLKYDGITSISGPAPSEGNMWATLHSREDNNLDGITLIPAPKYGQTRLDHGREDICTTEFIISWFVCEI